MRPTVYFLYLLAAFWATFLFIGLVGCAVSFSSDPAQFEQEGIYVFPMWGLVGVCMALGTLLTGKALARRIEPEDRLRKEFPNEPTKWSEEWLQGRGQTDYEWLYGRDFLLHFGMFLTPLTLTLLPIGLAKDRIDAVAIVALVAGLSMGIVSLLVWAYLRSQMWRGRKFEVSFNPIPLECGKPAAFVLNFGELDQRNRTVRIRLRCIYRHRASSSRPPSTKVEFTETQTVTLPRSADGPHQLSAAFNIPYEVPETSFEKYKNTVVRWELRVCTSGMIPRMAQFVVPVR